MYDFASKFRADGFCVLEDFLTLDEVNELRNEGMKLCASIPDQSERVVFSTVNSEAKQNKNTYFLDSCDKISYFFEDGVLNAKGELEVDPQFSLNKVGHALHILNPAFKKITFDERVKEVCFQLGFQEPCVVQSMYIYKNPKHGGEAHQDASYLHTDPVKILGIWIALDDVTLENGCLRFIRGSHKGGVHRRYIKNPDTTSDELLIYDSPQPIYQQHNFVPVPVSKGSCILIDGQVVHASDVNKSTKARNVYTFHVIERNNCKYSENNWIQPTNDNPFLNVYKTK